MNVELVGNVPINRYYVQMLCMIFFPGAKFSENPDEKETSVAPHLYVNVQKKDSIITATCRLEYMGKVGEASRDCDITTVSTEDRAKKLAIGAAVLAVGGEVLEYRPSWGMLTGVRPAKVAMEMLAAGNSKTKVRKILNNEFLVIPKKAALATEVALNEREIIANVGKKDCSVYISVPFCPSRCTYCSFVSYTSNRLLSLIPEYVIRVCRDIRATFKIIDNLGMNVKTIYIGGGTPTILSAEQLNMLLSTISECTDISRLEEYTLESGRPDTIDAEKLAIAADYGVTRICVNPQSLCDKVLTGIGRSHTSEDFFRAYDIARSSGIRYINTDLIAGLPGDNFKTFSSTFDKILSLSPDNITVHTFCIKKAADIIKQGSSVFSRSGGDTSKCVDYTQLKANQAGYKPYYMYRQKNTVGNLENVGFAKPGAEGLYNIYMMEEVQTIFAIGAGAVTKLLDYDAENASKTRIKRIFNDKYPFEYLKEDRTETLAREAQEFFAAN